RPFSDTPHLDMIEPSCSSFKSVGYSVPGLTDSRSPLVCSMRRAMPNPCCAPSASSVVSTMSASVPCHTSVLSCLPSSDGCVIWETQRMMPHLLWEYNWRGWEGSPSLNRERSPPSSASRTSAQGLDESERDRRAGHLHSGHERRIQDVEEERRGHRQQPASPSALGQVK